MRRLIKYRFTIEDESHLRTISVISASPWAIALWIAVVTVVVFVVAGGLIMVTPLRRILPGYLNNTERVATEENLLRLDSLQEVYSVNQAYIDNFLRITNTDRLPTDSAFSARQAIRAVSDSLLPASEREKKFISSMEERERFNISVLAPLAADGIMLSPVSAEGIFTSSSHGSEVGEIMMPRGSSVQSIADGITVSVHYSAADRGYEVIVQHNRGFLSSYSATGTPLVAPGDAVIAGQALAIPREPDSRGKSIVRLRMWHNGLPLIPYEYVGTQSSSELETKYEDKRGKD